MKSPHDSGQCNAGGEYEKPSRGQFALFNALEVAVEKISPVLYLGEGPTGLHLFASRGLKVTHSFRSFAEAERYFKGRTIIDPK